MLKKMSWVVKLSNLLNGLKSWQVFCVMLIMGFCTFFTGLTGGFQGDDGAQIVDNLAVHSISNVASFFGSGTFWNGEALVGDFYRPMMSTTFSLVYSLFGANPIAYHIFQLLIYIACSFVLYSFLKKFFKPSVALLISLVFLVHPLNSQVVYSIPCMQEPLYFLFGILALFIISRSKSTKSLIIALIFLLFSMLSKETGIVFACLSILYLFIYNRTRVVTFLKISIIPAVIYLALRASAIGLLRKTIQVASIDSLNLGERLLMIPSLIMFYVSKFFYPDKLATSYYWIYKTVSINGFWLPLISVLMMIACFVYFAVILKKSNKIKQFNKYLFFLLWASLGILPSLQIIPLDMTACETWFFCAMPGFLGMIFMIIPYFFTKLKTEYLLLIFVPILVIIGVRTSIRGLDYHSQSTLSMMDIKVSPDNYLSMNNLAKTLIDQKKLDEAMIYAQQSISIYPSVSNYTNLGVIYQNQGMFLDAKKSYESALKYGSMSITYENLGIVNLTIGKPDDNINFLHNALGYYPRSNRLWTYLAIQEAANGSNDNAKIALSKAISFGSVPKSLYAAIFNKQPLDVPMPGSDKVIHIP